MVSLWFYSSYKCHTVTLKLYGNLPFKSKDYHICHMVTLKLYGNLPYNQNTILYIDKQFIRYLRYVNNTKKKVHHTMM